MVNVMRCLELKLHVLEPDSKEMGVANIQLAEAYVAVLNFKEGSPYCLKELGIHKKQLGDNSHWSYPRRLHGVVYTGLENELPQKLLKN